MSKVYQRLWGALIALVLVLGGVTPAQAAVSVQLCFALDGSSSISPSNFSLMTNGLANALANASVMPQNGTVEVIVVQFADAIPGGARVEVQPTVITNSTVANSVAAQVRAIVQEPPGTPMDAGIRVCTQAITSSPQFTGTPRQLINIATDGEPDSEAATVVARNQALAAGIDEIDAEAIGSGVSPTTQGFIFLRDQIVFPQPGIQAPPFTRGGFVVSVSDFAGFPAAIAQKVQAVTQVTPTASPVTTVTTTPSPVVPELPPLALFGSGLLGLALWQGRRRRRTSP